MVSFWLHRFFYTTSRYSTTVVKDGGPAGTSRFSGHIRPQISHGEARKSRQGWPQDIRALWWPPLTHALRMGKET